MSKLKPFSLIFFGLICTTLFYWILSRIENQKSSSSPISYIAQTGPIKEGLKTDYLAELLQLSVNHPHFLDSEQTKKILKQSPFIKEVEVSTLNPETLYIDYTLRKPCFLLSDVSNVAMDETGHLFPLSPFYTPKKLPELFLGLDTLPEWSNPIQEKKISLALKLMEYLGNNIRVSRIDLSQIYADTLGRREIVLILDNENGNEHYLRLTPKSYEKELSHYFTIREKLLTSHLVIDLRVSTLAFLNPID